MKKLTCSLITLSLLSNFSAFALITETYENTYQIGEGITYSHVAGTNSSGPQRSNIFEYTPNSNVSPMVFYGNNIYGGLNINTASSMLKEQGYNVLGGVNGDFYTLSTGVALGLVIKDGQIMSSDAWQNAIGFKADGSAFIDRPGMDMKLYFGDSYVQVNYFNKVRTSGYVYMFDSNFGSATRVSSSGTDFVLQRLDQNTLTPSSNLTFEVVDIRKTSSSQTLLENQFVLSIDDKYTNGIPDIEIGQVVTLSTNVSNKNWCDATYAIGGQTILIKDGILQSGFTAGTNPRTAMGIKADGTVVVYEVDGRNSSFSNGLSLADLALEMQALGCVDAINLDGGGSSSVVAQNPGSTSPMLVNSPSEGSLRSNANYIFFVNNTSPTGNLANIHVYPETNLMLLNSTINLDIKGTDDNYYAVDISDDAKSMTTINGEYTNSTFTPSAMGETIVTADYKGFSNTTTINVLDSVDTITVVNNATNDIITSLSINQGESIDLNASSTYKYHDVKATDLSYTWEVTGDIGTIDSNGVFTSNSSRNSGSIIITYGKYSRKEIPVSVGYGSEPLVNILADFEVPYNFDTINAIQSYDDLYVSNGKLSAKFDYTITSSINPTISTKKDIGYNTILNFKFLGDGSKNEVYANFYDENNEIISILGSIINKTSEFTSISLDIPKNAVSFAGFEIKGSPSSGTIYLDHIVFSTDINDNLAPIVNLSSVPSKSDSISVTGTMVNDSTNSLNKQNISVKLNGIEQSFSYTMSSGNFSFNTNNLRFGSNRLVISASDAFGNISVHSYDVICENQSNSSNNAVNFIDISSSWAKDYINFASENGFISGQVIDGNSYFNPDRNLTRTEFAVIMSRLLNLNTTNVVATTNFSDLDQIASWALPHITAVSNAGIMNGSLASDGSIAFNGENPITRAEVFAVLGRITNKGFSTFSPVFSDSADIPNWSLEHFSTLINLGIVNGYTDDTIRPLNNISRAEVCKLIYTIY